MSVASTAWAQSVTTTPMGIVTVGPVNMPASGPVYFYYGAPLTTPAVYRGKFSAVSAPALFDDGASWTLDQFNPTATTSPRSHYIEITSGALQGTLFDIVKTLTASITVDYAFGPESVSGTSYAIRPHRTIAGMFGATNSTGLRGGTESTADLLSLWNGTAYRDFYYSTAAGATGWRRVGDATTDQAGVVIRPTEGIFFKFVGGTVPAITLLGELQTGPLAVPIVAGTNLVSPTAAVGLTLGTSGLFTNDPATGVKAGSPTTADIVSLFNGTAFDDYYVRSTAAGVQGWRRAGDVATDRAGVAIPAGTAFIVKRTADPRPFVWKRPSLYTSTP